jgi:16S rRNA (guanine527-N7)-methyltransferase
LENPGIWFSNICRKNGLSLTGNQLVLLEQYVALLLEWNKKINLVSRKDEDRIWPNHILHCVSILFKLGFHPEEHILDLGTGGGLPGIPLKILLPNSRFVLIDATRKKASATQDMIDRLGLVDIQALWGRAEDLAKDQNLVSRFGYIVARAVAPLKDIIKWSSPFAQRGIRKESGSSGPNALVQPPAIILLKGGDLEEEIEEAKRKLLIRKIEVINLVFQGSEEISNADKKIVVVKL